jgi:hypothetical protein
MLHARDDFLADIAAFAEIDAVQLVEQGFVREGFAEAIIQAAFRDAKSYAIGVIVCF